MFEWLTPGERRGAAIFLLLMALGAIRDLVPSPPPDRPAPDAATPSGPTVPPPPAPSAAGPGGDGPPHETSHPLDLNRVGAAELEALPGIGPVLAERIVRHREAHGGFARIEELLGVRGVGPRLYARLKPLVRVAPAVQSAASAPLSRADSTSVARPLSR